MALLVLHRPLHPKTPEPYAPSILIVDDAARVRMLMRRLLEQAGFFVYEAISARDALHAIDDRYFDLIITDLSLPGMDGFELMEAVRQQSPQIKLIVVSGHVADEIRPLAARMGADAALEKTLAASSLLATVCSVLAS